MISKSFQDNLRRNRFRIAALQSQLSDYLCCYKYNDGTMCAAAACLPDGLIDSICSDGQNTRPIYEVGRLYHISIPSVLNRFQVLHDNYLKSRFRGGPDIKEKRTAFIIFMCRLLDTPPK